PSPGVDADHERAVDPSAARKLAPGNAGRTGPAGRIRRSILEGIEIARRDRSCRRRRALGARPLSNRAALVVPNLFTEHTEDDDGDEELRKRRQLHARAPNDWNLERLLARGGLLGCTLGLQLRKLLLGLNVAGLALEGREPCVER